jgi:hypothetical protein
MQNIDKLMDKIIELRKQIYNIQYELFMDHILFSLKWWILLFVAILVCFIWWKLVDKKRFNEIALVGFVAALITVISDAIGLEKALWAHPIQLLGTIRHIHEIELIVIPVIYMLLYQYFGEWKKYIIAVIAYAIVGAYIIIPLNLWFGTYKIIKWKLTYSFITFIIIGIMIKFILRCIINVQKRFTTDAD